MNRLCTLYITIIKIIFKNSELSMYMMVNMSFKDVITRSNKIKTSLNYNNRMR